MNANQLPHTDPNPAVLDMHTRLEKKHPSAWEISVSTTRYGLYARVQTDDASIDYTLNIRGHLRVSSRRTLNPTEKSVRLQPKDCVVVITGEGPHKGKYVIGYEGDGWLKTTGNIADVKPMRRYDADSFRGYIAHHSQYCYGGKFEISNVTK